MAWLACWNRLVLLNRIDIAPVIAPTIVFLDWSIPSYHLPENQCCAFLDFWADLRTPAASSTSGYDLGGSFTSRPIPQTIEHCDCEQIWFPCLRPQKLG